MAENRPVRLIPRELLFGNPTRFATRLSPDGRTLAWIAPDRDVLNIWVHDLDNVGDDDNPPQCVTDDRDRGIREFEWAPDSRHILFLFDPDGAENHQLHVVDLATRTTRTLTPTDGVKALFVRTSTRRPTEVLVGLNLGNRQLHDAYLIDFTTGEAPRKVWENPGLVMWVADDDLVVRAGMQPHADGGMSLVVRDVDPEWRTLLHVGHEDVITTRPLTFSPDGHLLYCLTSHGANTTRLLSYELTGPTVTPWWQRESLEPTVLASDATADVTAVFFHPTTRRPRIAMVAQERLRPVVLDDDVTADVACLTTLGGDLTVLGADAADTRWLVATNHDNGPVRYYTYERTTHAATFMFSHRPELDVQPLAEMRPFTTTARDGLTLPGYVTFPRGVPAKNLPTVLRVHGGPWHRDMWGFDPEVQWLANRGYLVVQVDFRGSTGHGKAFLNAGDREWGAAMQNDLVDAVAYAVDEGWADPGRVAIFGASFGGYAALAGAAFTPDVFAAAVSLCGPANLVTLIRAIPPFLLPVRAQMVSRIGDPELEPQFLLARSPVSAADRIRIPVLIGQGANDVRVPVAEAEQIVAALNANGVPHQYLLYPDEGHGLTKPDNRLHFYAAVEEFLAKHLGGRSE